MDSRNLIMSLPLATLRNGVWLLILIIGASCAVQQPDIYYWGNYESIILNMYKNPGEEAPAVQIDKLNTDIQMAANKGKPVPPGVYAHLGFVYAANGNLDKAMEAFNQEKTIYPEAKIFIEGIEKRALGTWGNQDRNE